jgi:predicted metal-dependent hydrolase
MNSSGSIYINDQEYIYIIHRKKIKNIYFRVKEDLKIHVSAHPLVSEKRIQKLLLENALSIYKMYQKIASKPDLSLYYLGDKLYYEYQNSKPYIEGNFIYGKTEEECQKHIHKIASDVFNQRLERLRIQFNNLPEFKLKVRKMTSRWGVCNHKAMSVTLNLDLITKNVNLIDYVIIHELCHFKHLNHSKEFWAYVSEFCLYYKELRKELNH